MAAPSGDPRFSTAADLLGQALNATSIAAGAGSMAAGGLVVAAAGMITAAIAEKAKLSMEQQAALEPLLSLSAASVFGIGGAVNVAELVNQVRIYGKLESQRNAAKEARKRILMELAIRGASRVQYTFTEAELRGVEVGMTTAASRYLLARDVSMVFGNILLVANPAFAVVWGAIALIDHAIWGKRVDTARRRRARAVSAFAIEFATMYSDAAALRKEIEAFRMDEANLYVDERIERLKAIRAMWAGWPQSHQDEVYDLLTLPDENFIDGSEAAQKWYESVEAAPISELERALGSPKAVGVVSGAVKVAGVLVAAYLIGLVAGVA